MIEPTAADAARLAAIADALSIGRLRHHIFLCAEASTPNCATPEEGRATWAYTKARLKELDLASAPPALRTDPDSDPVPQPGAGSVLRTGRLPRVCEQVRSPSSTLMGSGIGVTRGHGADHHRAHHRRPYRRDHALQLTISARTGPG
jgi:hypothetical protein